MIYDVTPDHLESELIKLKQADDLIISEINYINQDKKDAFVSFYTKEEAGFAFIQMGLNKKYIISDIAMSAGEVKSIEYIVNGEDYTILLGNREFLISSLTFYPKGLEHVEIINDKKFFLLRYERGYEGALQIVSNDVVMEDLIIKKTIGNSWKNFLIPLGCFSIVLFSYLLTLPLNYKFRRYKLQELNDLPMEDQRIKQFKRI